VTPPVEAMVNVQISSALVATHSPVFVFLDYNVVCRVRLLQIVIKQTMQLATYVGYHVAVPLADVWISVWIIAIVTAEGARNALMQDAAQTAMLLVPMTKNANITVPYVVTVLIVFVNTEGVALFAFVTLIVPPKETVHIVSTLDAVANVVLTANQMTNAMVFTQDVAYARTIFVKPLISAVLVAQATMAVLETVQDVLRISVREDYLVAVSA